MFFFSMETLMEDVKPVKSEKKIDFRKESWKFAHFGVLKLSKWSQLMVNDPGGKRQIVITAACELECRNFL